MSVHVQFCLEGDRTQPEFTCKKCAFVRKEEQFAISREIHEGVNFLRGEKENKIEGTLPFPWEVDGLF